MDDASQVEAPRSDNLRGMLPGRRPDRDPGYKTASEHLEAPICKLWLVNGCRMKGDGDEREG